MSSQPTTFLTPAEYLELERKAKRKSEYFHGEMFAMAGASPRHGLIVTNLVGELRQHLKARPCGVYSNDVRLRVSPAGLYTYPDVTVVFGGALFADDQKDSVRQNRVDPVAPAAMAASGDNMNTLRVVHGYQGLEELFE